MVRTTPASSKRREQAFVFAVVLDQDLVFGQRHRRHVDGRRGEGLAPVVVKLDRQPAVGVAAELQPAAGVEKVTVLSVIMFRSLHVSGVNAALPGAHARFSGGCRERAPRERAGSTGLEGGKLLGQAPQRPVESDVLVGGMDGPGAHPATASRAAAQATTHQVLLHAVHGQPQAVAGIGGTPCAEQCLRLDGRPLLPVVAIAQRQRGACVEVLFAGVEGQAAESVDPLGELRGSRRPGRRRPRSPS